MGGEDVAGTVHVRSGNQMLGWQLVIARCERCKRSVEPMGQRRKRGQVQHAAEAVAPFAELAAELRNALEIDDDAALGDEAEFLLVWRDQEDRVGRRVFA